jgi:acetolactate synthase-1/3 small subunit
VVFLKAGHYEETQGLFEELAETIGVLQFVRSGRIAITKSKVERLSDMLAKWEQQRVGFVNPENVIENQ